MKITLSVASINDAIGRLDTLKSNIEVAQENTIDILVNKGGEQAIMYNNMAPSSGIEKSKVVYKTTESGKSGYIALTGENAVYDEFGTGEEGASNAHPYKGEFGLNAYNSGPYVSTHINPFTGKYYWIIPDTYFVPNEYVENTGYTEGIPSGKQMYSTDNYIKFIKNSVIEKEFNGAVKKFNKK